MSVDQSHFRDLQNFLVAFVHNFNVTETGNHVALVTFNHIVEVVFPFTKYTEESSMKKAIASISDQRAWQTRTDKALRVVEQEIFTAEAGDRPDRPNFLFLFTDAKPTGQGREDFEPISTVISRLEASLVSMFKKGFL